MPITSKQRKLRVRDRVRVRGLTALGAKLRPEADLGKRIGTVACVLPSGTTGVRFARWNKGHTLDGRLSTTSGYWFFPSELTLVKSACPRPRAARGR